MPNLQAEYVMLFGCRSKRILGFQRQGGSNQARLHWHGRAADIDEYMDEGAGNNDDAAMAAADNVELDFV